MEETKTGGQVKVNINLDSTPILYIDHIFIGISPEGVVFDFGQKLGPTNELRIVSRIGMSPEHAKKFYKTFTEQLKLLQGQIDHSKMKIN